MPDDARTAVAAASRRLAEAGLLIGTAGNVSAVVPGTDLLAVTATGAVLGTCTPEQISLVDSVGRVVEGDLAPTSEVSLHLGLVAAGARAVVHTHAPYATAVACVLDELPVLHYQQLSLGGAVRVAAYHTFGTPELADAVGEALEGRQAVLLANHGSVTVGGSLDEAVERALLLEWLCALHLRAATLGTPRALTEQQQLDVIAQAIQTKYGHTRAADEEA